VLRRQRLLGCVVTAVLAAAGASTLKSGDPLPWGNQTFVYQGELLVVKQVRGERQSYIVQTPKDKYTVSSTEVLKPHQTYLAVVKSNGFETKLTLQK
jgi:hypothetical protein